MKVERSNFIWCQIRHEAQMLSFKANEICKAGMAMATGAGVALPVALICIVKLEQKSETRTAHNYARF